MDDRKSGIGGTDISAILGMNPWRTAVDVWAEKVGLAPTDGGRQASERMEWGLRFEDAIARRYAETRGVKLRKFNSALRDPKEPFIMGHIDRAVGAEGTQPFWRAKDGVMTGASAILEIKTASESALQEWGEPGTDQIPRHYWLQVQWYLGITKVERGDVAVLFGGQRYREYVVAYDDALFRDVRAFASRWWNTHVVGNTPPPPSTGRDVAVLFPKDAGTSVVASQEIDALVSEALEYKAKIEELTAKYDSAVDKIKVYMEAGSELVASDGRLLATWRATKPSLKTDWKAVAEHLGAGKELIEANTVQVAGVRRFLLKGAS